MTDTARHYIKENVVFITPLLKAVEHSDLEIVRELLIAEAIIDDSFVERNKLTKACKKCKYKAVKLLLKILSDAQNKVDICNKALFAVIKNNNDKVVSLLQNHNISLFFKMF